MTQSSQRYHRFSELTKKDSAFFKPNPIGTCRETKCKTFARAKVPILKYEITSSPGGPADKNELTRKTLSIESIELRRARCFQLFCASQNVDQRQNYKTSHREAMNQRKKNPYVRYVPILLIKSKF
jgi:hypothetical protein